MNDVCAITQGIQEVCPPTLIKAKCECVVPYDDYAVCRGCGEPLCDAHYFDNNGRCNVCHGSAVNE